MLMQQRHCIFNDANDRVAVGFVLIAIDHEAQQGRLKKCCKFDVAMKMFTGKFSCTYFQADVISFDECLKLFQSERSESVCKGRLSPIWRQCSPNFTVLLTRSVSFMGCAGMLPSTPTDQPYVKLLIPRIILMVHFGTILPMISNDCIHHIIKCRCYFCIYFEFICIKVFK